MKIMYRLLRRIAAPGIPFLLAGAIVAGPAPAALPKAPAGANAVAAASVTNGILTVDLEPATGYFTISTGSSHPQPGKHVFFPLGTSYISLRDATSSQIFVDCPSYGSPVAGLAGYTLASMCATSPAVTTTGNGFHVVFTLANWTVAQDVVINGTTLADTNVRHTVSVTNTSGGTRQYGLRYLWDWEIANSDLSIFRQRNPDAPFTSVPATFPNPAFGLYEEVDNIATPTFSVFGSVAGLPLTPAPTPPEQIRYSDWVRSYDNAWDYTDPGTTGDSSVTYYWGYANPLTLQAGASASYTQYVTTQLAAIGGTPQPPAVARPVPALAPWGIALAGLAIALFGAWAARRR